MEQELVSRFDAKRDEVRNNLVRLVAGKEYCIDYIDIVKIVIEAVHDDYRTPDPNNIHEINDGDYQGALLFVIPQDDYQPWDYWYVKISYGSCSGCDTLQAILSGYYGDTIEEKADALFILALHIIQELKRMG